MSWVTLTQANVPQYFPELVVGGYGSKCYFIGRTIYKDEVVIGKVRCTYLETMYFAYEGKELTTKNFEMLAYSESFAIRAYCRDETQICPK